MKKFILNLGAPNTSSASTYGQMGTNSINDTSSLIFFNGTFFFNEKL